MFISLIENKQLQIIYIAYHIHEKCLVTRQGERILLIFYTSSGIKDKSSWRNRLARSTVNREVVGSIPTEDALLIYFFVLFDFIRFYSTVCFREDSEGFIIFGEFTS